MLPRITFLFSGLSLIASFESALSGENSLPRGSRFPPPSHVRLSHAPARARPSLPPTAFAFAPSLRPHRLRTRDAPPPAPLFSSPEPDADGKGMDRAVLVECGSGCCHGRDSTKAALRACRDAMEYNSVKISTVVPGGYEALKIHVHVGVPDPGAVDLRALEDVFPYGTLCPIVVERGGLRGSNTVKLAGTGAAKEDMTLAVACITLGYDENFAV